MVLFSYIILENILFPLGGGVCNKNHVHLWHCFMKNLSINKLNKRGFCGRNVLVSGMGGWCSVLRKFLHMCVISQCLFFKIKSSVI